MRQWASTKICKGMLQTSLILLYYSVWSEGFFGHASVSFASTYISGMVWVRNFLDIGKGQKKSKMLIIHSFIVSIKKYSSTDEHIYSE